MSNKLQKEELFFDSSVKKSEKGKPILGKLRGVCADTFSPTRNGRKYSEELWTKVFNDPIIKEYFDCGGIMGELGHPEDRTEIDIEKVAVCMPKIPTKNSKGLLEAEFDILDTPNGRILKTLCEYGYKLGISSRGNGDLFTDYDGNEAVDPESYELSAFDIVLLPAVKAARLTYESLTESLNSKKSIKVALKESYDRASDEDKRIMASTLKELDLGYNPTEDINIDVDSKTESAVVNDMEDVVQDLQEALKNNAVLETKLLTLNEQLSVSYAKEAKQEELVEKYRNKIDSLTSKVGIAESIKQELASTKKELLTKDEELAKCKQVIEQLTEKLNKSTSTTKRLSEQLRTTSTTAKDLDGDISSLKSQLLESKANHDKEKTMLTEQIQKLQKDSESQRLEYSSKLHKANQLTERYKSIASKTVDKYIELRARQIGVQPQEIKHKLQENYSFKDIDEVCEQLQEHNLRVSKLPFYRLQEDFSNKKVKVTESKNSIVAVNDGDIIDSSLEYYTQHYK